MRGRKKILCLALCAVLLLAAAAALPRLRAVGADIERRREEAIREAVLRAAFQCYAVEGVYPAALGELESGYGLLLNHERYIVSYDCYASNRPPEVRVLKR